MLKNKIKAIMNNKVNYKEKKPEILNLIRKKDIFANSTLRNKGCYLELIKTKRREMDERSNYTELNSLHRTFILSQKR